MASLDLIIVVIVVMPLETTITRLVLPGMYANLSYKSTLSLFDLIRQVCDSLLLSPSSRHVTLCHLYHLVSWFM
jgi:hypothetical protein